MRGFGLMRITAGFQIMRNAASYRRSWPFFRTPIGVFLMVMAPIGSMMAIIVIADTPSWMTWSAGVVLAITLLTLYQGYVRRLILSDRGARFVGVGRVVEIQPSCVSDPVIRAATVRKRSGWGYSVGLASIASTDC